MILLFIRRIRHAFGDEDAPAKRMASSILSDLDLATITAKEAPRNVTLPFLIAAVEASGSRERDKIIHDIPIYGDVVSAKSQQISQAFLEELWDVRDRSPGFRWVDMMHTLPPICVIL